MKDNETTQVPSAALRSYVMGGNILCLFPDSLRGDGAGGEVGGRAVVEERRFLDPPPQHGVDGVRSGATELTLHDEAHGSTRRRKDATY
jgi:hypothetical protein